MQTGTVKKPLGALDYELVFQQMPGLCLILDPAFTIVAQNEQHARITETQAVGQNLFAAFPDNPNDSGAMKPKPLEVLKNFTVPIVMEYSCKNFRAAKCRCGTGFTTVAGKEVQPSSRRAL